MAIITYKTSNSSAPYITLEVTQQSQSIASNYSTVAYTLQMHRPSAIEGSSTDKAWSVVINGKTVASGTRGWNGSGTITIASGTTRVNHNSDGSKTLNFSFSVFIGVTWGGYGYIGTGESSGSMTLTTIPRASTLSTSSSTVEIGKSVVLTINRASTTFKHKIYYKLGNMTSYVQGHTDDYIYTGYTFIVPTSTLANLPNSTSGDLSFQINTYNSSNALIGTTHTKMKATVASSVIPSISTTLSEINGLGDKYIRTKSKVRVTPSATPGTGARITKIEYTLKNRDGNAIEQKTINGTTAYESSELNWYGTHTIIARVVDSRGRSATSTRTFNVEYYSQPSFTSIEAYRSDFNGVRSSQGGHITIKATITFAAATTIKRLTLSKMSGTETIYSNVETKSISTSTYTYTKTIPAGLTETHLIKVSINDNYSTYDRTFKILSNRVPISFHKTGRGVAIGKTAEKENRFEIGYLVDRFPLYSHEELVSTLVEGVTNLKVQNIGNIVSIRFDFKPTTTGFTKIATIDSVLAPNVALVPLTVVNSSSTPDNDKGISGFINATGIFVIAPVLPNYASTFYAMYFTLNGLD